MAKRIDPVHKSVKQILEDLGHGFRAILASTTALERGVQARSGWGEFHEALELCTFAISLDLGAHWLAKRDSLDWAG